MSPRDLWSFCCSSRQRPERIAACDGVRQWLLRCALVDVALCATSALILLGAGQGKEGPGTSNLRCCMQEVFVVHVVIGPSICGAHRGCRHRDSNCIVLCYWCASTRPRFLLQESVVQPEPWCLYIEKDVKLTSSPATPDESVLETEVLSELRSKRAPSGPVAKAIRGRGARASSGVGHARWLVT